MMQDRDAGREVEVDVPLAIHRIPAQASVLRSLAERVRVAMGMRLLMGDTDPLPLSASFAAWLLCWDTVRDKRRASRAIDGLERWRVIRYVGSLPARGKPDGTKCYQPFDFDLVALLGAAELPVESGVGVPQPGGTGVQRSAVAVEVVAQPLREGESEAVMDGAVARDHHDLRVVTARDAADGHVPDGNARRGGSGGAR